MTIDETKDELYRLLSDCVNNSYPIRNNTQKGRYRNAVKMAIASLEAWEEVKADIDNLLYVDSLIFGELMDFAEGKISADDVIDEFNRVAKAEIMKIISEHLPEEYQHE